MEYPSLFIGSSKENIEVAQLFHNALTDECAKVTLWDHGVFGLNESSLDSLLNELKKCEFAAFILAGDDAITIRDKTMRSPRDNILFESGLFMGALGRTNTFLIYEERDDLKIPSDLAGLTLASYDDSLIKAGNAAGAIKKACGQIHDIIVNRGQPVFHLIGKWKSIYPMPFEKNIPTAREVVEIFPFRDGISLFSQENSQKDYYKATGRVVNGKIIGEWNSIDSDSSGIFMLIISSEMHSMYGFFTVPDAMCGVRYAYWVLAKMEGADDETIERRLTRAMELLHESLVAIPLTLSNSGI